MEVYQKNDCKYSAHIFTFFVKINWMNQKLSFYLQENAEPGMTGRADGQYVSQNLSEMEEKIQCPFVWSASFPEITSPKFRGWIIHLLCRAGECTFIYNRKYMRLRKNDALVLSRPDLVSDITCGEDLEVEFVAAPARFLYSLMPANHYGIGGGISLFNNPLMPLSEKDAAKLQNDIRQIRMRMGETDHRFYMELMGSLAQTMVYDLFDFHARLHAITNAGEQTVALVRCMTALMDQGTCRTQRTVAWYAEQLNVTPKYLSETVKRATGHSVMHFIDQYTLSIVINLLKNSPLSLTAISEEMNFTSLSYFTRYVRKHLGMFPGEYRKSLLPVDDRA